MAKVEELRKLAILDVAQSLGMDFKRVGHDNYAWVEHDSFIINTTKNIYSWFSRDIHGDVFSLVQTIKEYQTGQPVLFKAVKRYLETGEFERANIIEQPRPTFSYYLGQYETQDMTKTRDYLRQERGLSDETIDHFIDQGLLAQATKKTGSVYEPVIVFKTLDKAGEVTGASLQGIVENRELHKRGRLKQLMRASDGLSGMTLDIGQPKRLVFAESPIDLMSYYQLKKDQLSDVRLVAMDGLKEETVSRHFVELRAEMAGVSYKIDPKLTPSLLAKTAQMTDDFRNGHFQDTITLAVDNDEAGRKFVAKLQNKGIPVTPDLPPLRPGEEKADWNDYLKQKGPSMEQDKSKLAQAKGKLDRLEKELAEITEATFAHQRQTNGQPMNDKRGGQAFRKRHEQLVERAISKTREIERQKELIERLEWAEDRRSRGFNRRGNGLEMSVANIPRIREEIERFYRGESYYTRATIKGYEKRLEELEAMAEQAQKAVSPGLQELIDQDLVKQWAKQPTIYFVKGLNKVALVQTATGDLEVSAKYPPKTEKDQERVQELLGMAKDRVAANQEREEPQEAFLDQEKSGELSGYQVRLRLAEGALGEVYEEGQLIPYEEFATTLYKLNDDLFPRHMNSLEAGMTYVMYEKVRFDILDPLGATLFGNERAEIGEVTYPLSHGLGSSREALELKEIDRAVLRDWQKPAQEKSLEKTQGIDNTDGELFNRNSSFLGEDSPGTAPQPVEHIAQPNFPTNVYLHFTTGIGDMSNKAFRKNMRTLNLYANTMRDSAQWYLSKVADTTISYVYKTPQEERLQILSVRFDKKNWMHLTGVKPVYENRVDSLSEQFIDDVANSRGHFKNLKFASGVADKLKVLNLLPEIIESDTFLFNDLSSVEKLSNLDLSKALNPEDKDLLLLFKEEGLHQVPASLMRIKGELKESLANIDTGTVLGVYQERDGVINQLSINEDYIKDGGAEMMAIMRNNSFEKEEAKDDIILSDSVGFVVGADPNRNKMTRVLDTIRELGRPVLDPQRTPDVAQELAHVDRLLDQFQGNLDLVITELALSGQVDHEDNFYREWVEDMVHERHQVSWADVANGRVSQDDFAQLAAQTLDDLATERRDFLAERRAETPNLAPSSLAEAVQFSPTRVKELVAQKDTKELGEYMKAGIRTYLDSDQYRNFLTAMAKVPNYSANNLMLLQAQKEDIQAVASFKVWKEKFGRQVNKGEKALWIWAPMQLTKKDPSTGQPLLDENGQPKTFMSFKLVPVFDLGQTSGKDFPKAVNELEGSYDDYANLYRAAKQLANEKGVSVSLSDKDTNYKGYYSDTNKAIVIKQNMSEPQTLKTFFHELAHSHLHNKEAMAGKSYSRSEKELQAESVAFVMASHYGIDTSDYSFGYLANWSRDKEGLSDLEAQLNVVQKTAQELLHRLDAILENQQEKTKPKTVLDEKIHRMKEQGVTKPTDKAVTSEPKKTRDEQPNQTR